MDGDYDARVRAAAIDYVMSIADSSGGVVTREELEHFVFEGEQSSLSIPPAASGTPGNSPPPSA